jgi:NTP pyrophosphatase (non-canonical NTP hydrolase)
MELHMYQEAAKKFAVYPKHTAKFYVLLGLLSEAGEVAGKVKKVVRGDKNMALQDEEFLVELVHELGDCLWYIAMISEEFGLDLNDIAVANLEKLLKRKQAGTIKGSGDNR